MGDKMLFGISGSICAGKDVLAAILVGKYGFKSYSLVEILREEHEIRNKNIDTRQNRREFANERRQYHGAHYYVAEAYGWARKEMESAEDNIVLVGLYCQGEVDYLIDRLQGRLLGIVCNEGIETRYERYKARRESSSSPLSFEDFKDVDKNENNGVGRDDTNVTQALEFAMHVFNNDGDLQNLVAEVDEFAKNLGLEVLNPEYVAQPIMHSDNGYRNNRELQVHYEAFEFLKEHFSMKGLSKEELVLAPLLNPARCVREITNQFGMRIVPAFLSENVGDAWGIFREIIPSTTDEEMIFLTNRREFEEIHMRLHQFLDERRDDIEYEVKKNIERIKEFDVTQWRSGKRSVKEMRERGIEIRILPEHFEMLKRLQESMKSSQIPLLEVLKRDRIAEVNLIPNTKVGTIIHDAIDHVWFYALLADKGILKKYSKLFSSIGNPEKKDIFKREGEIVASIGYGVRYWAYVEAGFKPHVSIGQIAERVESYFDNGQLEDRHLDAYRHIRRLAKSPTMREAQSLAFVFSNYLVELNEQRRKHGPIKVQNEELEITGELDPWGPDFLCYFIEVHALLHDSKNKHRDNLLRAHIMLEQHLCSPSAAVEGNVLRIDADDLEKVDFRHVELPADRVLWMSRNYGFTAIKEDTTDSIGLGR
jgi:dephospho-CoA kinase